MLGAIAGDIIGSPWERHPHKSVEFPLFTPGCRITDDTVLTVASAHAILHGVPWAEAYHDFGNRYPNAGYGGAFRAWLASADRQPYGSWGNGSAMRVSPVGQAARTIDEALTMAAESAAATHDHPEGIRGAQAVAVAVHLAREGESKERVRAEVEAVTGYDLSARVDDIRGTYRFDVSCQGSVPEALTCFLEAGSVEQAIRLAVSLGGDADTQASIAGAIAEAHWGTVPADWIPEIERRLPPDLLAVTRAFTARHPMRLR